MRTVSFHEYVKEVLACAEYRTGQDLECIVAVASVLPGCMTQGKNVEEARDNLIVIRKLRRLGFRGPFGGGKHSYMKGGHWCRRCCRGSCERS
jgi:hypothetical protein